MVSYEYVLAGVLVSLLGSIFFMIISSTLLGKKQFKVSGAVKSNWSGNGEFLQEMEEEKSTVVIIVGAGVAGAALAYTLAKEGRRVHVIERDLSEPDRIVGELLQPGGYLKLIELGLEDCANESIDAQKVFGYALYKDGKDTTLSYPLEKYSSDVAGRSFHNGRFIQRMREKATTLSNVKMDRTRISDNTNRGKGHCQRGDLQEQSWRGDENICFTHALTIVCDGCF